MARESADVAAGEDLRVCVVCHFKCTGSELTSCPSCGALFDAQAELRVGDDVTPYALAERRDRRVMRAMRRWVYAASVQRIGHVALMGRSSASRRFVGRHLLWLALGAGVLQFATTGWHVVVRTADNALILQTQPMGRGWMEIARADVSPVTLGPLGLWWQPMQSGLALIVGMVSAWLMGLMAMGVLHGGSIGRNGRMEAAVDYGLAWTRAIGYAGLATIVLPVADLMLVWGIGFFPGRRVWIGGLSVVSGVSVLLYWFWLVRSAGAVPRAGRGFMLGYYAVAAPLLVGGLVMAWWIGLDRLCAYSWQMLEMSWRQT